MTAIVPLTDFDAAASRARLLSLYQLNRARFMAAGWRLSTYLALPALALRTALFPTDPPEAAPAAPPLPLLPRQRAVQVRLDSERMPPASRRPVGVIRIQGLLPSAPTGATRTRKVSTNRITPRPLVLRNGFWIEPLTHHAHGPRRHYAPRVGREA